MAIDPWAVASTLWTGPKAGRSAVDYQCDLVRGANRLPVANAAQGFSELEHGVRRFLEVEE